MNSENEEEIRKRIQDRFRVLHHSISIREEILSALIHDEGVGQLPSALREMVELCGADIGYLVILEKGIPLSVDFWTKDGEYQFEIPIYFDSGKIPEVFQRRTSPHPTIFSNLTLSDSLIFPLRRYRHPIGLMEVGQFSGSFLPEDVMTLVDVVDGLSQSFWALHEHLLGATVNRNLRIQLEQTERMYKTVMSGSHDMILSLDPKMHIVAINDHGKALLGLEDNDSIKSIRFLSPDFGFILEQLELKSSLSDIEVALVNKAEKTVYCLASFFAERDEKNTISQINGVFKDITDRIEAQMELWKTNLELTQLNEQLKSSHQQMVHQEKMASIGQLAAGIAHEINNPLGFVQSNHMTLKKYLERLTSYVTSLETALPDGKERRMNAKVTNLLEDIPQLLSESDDGYHRMTKIVQSLKDFSRVDAQGTCAPVDLNKALEDTLTVARNSWKYVARLETDFRLEAMTECYLDDLNQVFLNLVVNAAQAIEDLKKDEQGLIRIHTSQDDRMACIEIEDSGSGVPEHLKRRVFEPFFTTKPIGKGTGLGLSIAYDKIVKKHGGTIKIENSNLGGAKFIIRLPLVQRPNDPSFTEVEPLANEQAGPWPGDDRDKNT